MLLAEARRALNLCNICAYCNGFCEVFRAAKRRPKLSDADIVYLAHLCHNCRNCWPACQYGPGHPLAINIPKTLAQVRQQSWRCHPHLALLLALLIPLLTVLLVPWPVLFVSHIGPGAFYAVLPLPLLLTAAALPLAISLLALSFKLWRFWHASTGNGAGISWRALGQAASDIASLRNLDGGGLPCHDTSQGTAWRRRFHHLLFYGFLLCCAASAVAAFYHHALGWPAPYPLLSAPVLLGASGGAGIMLGCLGLAWVKWRADPNLDATPNDYSLLILLFNLALTGMALLALRQTALMGILLALHLGCVCGFFASLAWGKFAHAPFRAAALLRAAIDRQAMPIQPALPTRRKTWRLQPEPSTSVSPSDTAQSIPLNTSLCTSCQSTKPTLG